MEIKMQMDAGFNAGDGFEDLDPDELDDDDVVHLERKRSGYIYSKGRIVENK